MRHSFCKSTTWCPTFPSCCTPFLFWFTIFTSGCSIFPLICSGCLLLDHIYVLVEHIRLLLQHIHLTVHPIHTWVQRSYRSCATHTVRILKVSSRGTFPLEVVHLEAEAGYGRQHLRHGAVHHQRPAPQPTVSQPLTHRTVPFPPPARIETIK
jgi:hypothetical protein